MDIARQRPGYGPNSWSHAIACLRRGGAGRASAVRSRPHGPLVPLARRPGYSAAMNRLGAFLLFLIALLAAGPAAAQGGRHMEVRLVAGDGGGRARLDGHPGLRDAAGRGLARLLAQSGRRRRRSRASPGGCPRAGAPGRSTIRCRDRLIVFGPDELCVRARLCAARDVQRAGERRAGRDLPDRRAARLSGLHRSRSACPRPRPSRSSWRSARPARSQPGLRRLPAGAAAAARRARRGSRSRAGGCASPSRCRRRRGSSEPYFFPGDARRAALRRAAAHLAQRRHADRRDGGGPARRRSCRRSRACSRSRPAPAWR